jgi:Uma2 family endonuclease
MTALTLSVPVTLPAGEIIAADVSAGEYLAQYAETHHEWVRGAVIKMTPVSLQHVRLTQYLLHLLNAYFALNPIGTVLDAPFVMRLEAAGSYREPDLQVVLNTNPGQLTDTEMVGPADICIEVVSRESVTRDYGDKFAEYEQAGVQEYWIIDPVRQTCHFYRLQPGKHYAPVPPDEQGNYHTPLLPRLALHVPTLWQEPLPNAVAIVQAVQTMLTPG